MMRLILKRASICVCLSMLLWVIERATAQEKTAPQGARAANLEGRTWRMADNYKTDRPQQPPSRGSRHKPEAYIKFQDGTIEGSSGCGQLAGIYRRSDEQLMISVEWRNREETPCNEEEKEQARKVVRALTHVQRIQPEPRYWHSDALVLVDEEGKIQITLLPAQSGADLSELEDTFWRLTQLLGSNADFSNVVINIRDGDILFSTSSHFFEYPFGYRWAGLEFHPAWMYVREKNDSKFVQDEQLTTLFETALHKIRSYDLNADSLTFFNKDRQPIMVLSDFRKEGIENRRWRIAKYRGDGTQPSDEDGLVEARMAEITFLNGRVTGSPGCGAWSGTYKLSGGQLKVEAVLTLFGVCYPEQFTEGRLVENAFKGELQVTKKEDSIILRENNGKPRIVLVPY